MRRAAGTVLVIGPAVSAKGGIASAIKGLISGLGTQGRLVISLETMDDRSAIRKLLCFICAMLRLPWALSRVQLVHVHMSSGTSFYRKSVFIWAASLAKKRILIHLHPAHFIDFMQRNGAVRRRFITLTLLRAARIIVLSDLIARRLEEHIPRQMLKVLPNPCPCPVIDPKSLSLKRKHILFAGKLMASKGCGELLAAFATVARFDPEVHLTMAGNGAVEHFERIAENLGLSDRVTFTGWLASEDLLRLYQSAMIFCLPSYSEGLPVSVLEAMSQGAVPVVTPVGGIPDVVIDSENGLIVPVGDAKILSTKLLELLNAPAAARALAERAVKTVAAKYSVSIVAADLNKIYSDLEVQE